MIRVLKFILLLLFAVSGIMRVIILAIEAVVGKPPTESVFFEKYARIATVIDEVIDEVGGEGGGL